MNEGLKAQCHCGAVTVEIPRKPDFINDCNCSLCRNSGAVWGYFTEDQCVQRGKTHPYVRSDKPEPVVQIHSCTVCGATTHWTLTENYKAKNPGANRMGINMYLFADSELSGVELRFPDGKNWFGGPTYGYRQHARAWQEFHK